MRTIVILVLILFEANGFAQPAQSPTDGRIEQLLESYLQAPVLDPGNDPRYERAFADLKDDGNPEAIIYLTDPSWCGSGGCTALIFAPHDSGFELVTKITVTRLPIRLLKTKTNGWHDLSVLVAGGGISAHDVKLRFNGKTYPSSPSKQPAVGPNDEVGGQVVLPGPANQTPLSDKGKLAIEQVLHRQQDAWNRHDLDAFMQGYWNSPALTFFSGGQENHGWQAAMDRYRARYTGPGHEMGQLEFSDLRVELLGPESAFVRGAWHLTMSDGKTPHGLFTLVFRRFPDGWKIVHDHTSAAE